jgi:uncharacterized protein (DUF2141 family)
VVAAAVAATVVVVVVMVVVVVTVVAVMAAAAHTLNLTILVEDSRRSTGRIRASRNLKRTFTRKIPA